MEGLLLVPGLPWPLHVAVFIPPLSLYYCYSRSARRFTAVGADVSADICPDASYFYQIWVPSCVCLDGQI